MAVRSSVAARVLLCWESVETNSWNPVLAALLRERGHDVVEACDVGTLRSLDLSCFDVCLPRFRVGAAHMSCVDELLVESSIPMLNSREARRRCENKSLAHLAFERHGIPQPPAFVVSADGVHDRDLRWDGETIVKPLYGSRSSGIEICKSLPEALERAAGRREDLLVQQMIWPAKCWRVIVGRNTGSVDPYWREPPRDHDRVLSISTGSRIVRGTVGNRISEVAIGMLEAVDGDLLAVDILETETETYALEINHNFDAHGGDAPAADAFCVEIERKTAVPVG
jgi:glutathione synthase/RimK-type ligase-like ATP-grasp enzyme